MEPKFRMGIGKLRDASSNKLANEDAIAFELFKDTKDPRGHALFEAEGYVWRHMKFKTALQSMPSDLRKELIGNSRPQALQRMARFATEQFKILSDFGVPFEGRFIVHNVNRVVSLVSAVPKIGDKSPQNSVGTEDDWKRYVDEYEQLQRKLMAYFDSRVEGQQHILYDVARLSQYVYGNTHANMNAFPCFVLVDSDPLFDPTDGTGDYNREDAYKLFVQVAIEGIYEFLYDFHRNARETGLSLDIIANEEKQIESFINEWERRADERTK